MTVSALDEVALAPLGLDRAGSQPPGRRRYSPQPGQLAGKLLQCRIEPFSFGDASLRHIFTAAAAASQGCHGFLHQRAYVVWSAYGLRKDQRGLR